MARYTRNPWNLQNKVARESQELNLAAQLQLNLLFIAQEGVDTPFLGGLSGGGRKVYWSPDGTGLYKRLEKQAFVALRSQDDVNFGPFFLVSDLFLFGEDQQLAVQQGRRSLGIDNLPVRLLKRNELDWSGWMENQANQRVNLLSPEVLALPLAKRIWDESQGVPVAWPKARKRSAFDAAISQSPYDEQSWILQLSTLIQNQVELLTQHRTEYALPIAQLYKTRNAQALRAVSSQSDVYNPHSNEAMLPCFSAWTEPASTPITTSWTEPAVTPITSTWTEPASTPCK